jgi:DMSO/TMAO reductase YedYZ heme-binding membrane subunit
MNPQLWWFVARASGILAWATAAAAVIWGLSVTSKPLGRKPSPAWTLDLHRFLGALTMVFLGIHLAALVGDSFTEWTVADLTVPYATTWKPGPVAWGIIAGWFLLAVEVSSLLMRRLPRAWWRRIHLTSYVVLAAATIHFLSAGTDPGNPFVLVLVGGTTGLVLVLTAWRVVEGRRKAARRAASERPSRPSPRTSPRPSPAEVAAQRARNRPVSDDVAVRPG